MSFALGSLVYGTEPRILQQAPGGRENAKMVGKQIFGNFSLPQSDGNYFLRPDRILGAFLLDPANPIVGGDEAGKVWILTPTGEDMEYESHVVFDINVAWGDKCATQTDVRPGVTISTLGAVETRYDRTGADGVTEIRFPVRHGVAGWAVTNAQALNIKAAYEDERFNPDVDKKTGFITRSILCMPILSRTREVIGVTQMLNKRTGPFGADDEATLEALTQQVCGVACPPF